MNSLKDAIAGLRDERAERVIARAASDIDTVAHVLRIDPSYLSVQVRLHLPFYSADDLVEGCEIVTVRDTLRRLVQTLATFADLYRVHRELNGIDTLPRGSILTGRRQHLRVGAPGTDLAPVSLVDVPASFGQGIQKQLHYIHNYRTDTQYHLGLQVAGFLAPVCYCAVSALDREYLHQALISTLPSTARAPDRVAVLTRAFGYSPLPKNAMSKLFDLTAQRLGLDGYDYVVTALNPFLGFRGSIFGGASFYPFATSPMAYWYSPDGHYQNRRTAGVESHQQKCSTPPIVWLVRALHSRDQRLLDDADHQLYTITEQVYARG